MEQDIIIYYKQRSKLDGQEADKYKKLAYTY